MTTPTKKEKQEDKLYGVLQNVTKDLYKKNLALNIEHKRLEDILLQVAEVIFAVDQHCEISLFNAAAEKLFGIKKDTVIGNNPDNFLKLYSMSTGELINVGDFAFKKTLNSTLSKSLERVYFLDKNGVKTYFKLNFRNIYYAKSEKECVVSLVDITHEVQVDMQKDEFISIASHELKTPISIVKTNLWMLKHFDETNKNLDANQRKFLEEIDQGIVRLARIVNNLLDISRIEQGRFVIEEELEDVDAVIKGSIDTFKELAQGKNLKLVYPTKKIGKVYIDKDRFLEVLDNFISNAIKYTEKGGIKVNVWKEKKKIKVSITDTGPGISTEEQKRLFKKFSRAKEGLKQHSIGASTGLGLYISKRIVEEMNGEVGVKSTVGKGSTFWFTLPVSKLKHKKEGDVVNTEKIKQEVLSKKESSK